MSELRVLLGLLDREESLSELAEVLGHRPTIRALLTAASRAVGVVETRKVPAR